MILTTPKKSFHSPGARYAPYYMEQETNTPITKGAFDVRTKNRQFTFLKMNLDIQYSHIVIFNIIFLKKY